MIRSQEIALRCAAAMPSNLLQHGWARAERERLREVYGVSSRVNSRAERVAFLRQLDACSDDEARRLLMGKSR